MAASSRTASRAWHVVQWIEKSGLSKGTPVKKETPADRPRPVSQF